MFLYSFVCSPIFVECARVFRAIIGVSRLLCTWIQDTVFSSIPWRQSLAKFTKFRQRAIES